MTENKNSLRKEYKDLLPIDDQDYKNATDTTDSKHYYEIYLRIFGRR